MRMCQYKRDGTLIIIITYHCRNDRHRPQQITPTNKRLTCRFRESGLHRADDDAAGVCVPYKELEMWFYPTAHTYYCYFT